MREATPILEDFLAKGAPSCFTSLWGPVRVYVRVSVFWGPDVSLEVLCFCLCAGVISIQCPRGLGLEVPGSAPLDV